MEISAATATAPPPPPHLHHLRHLIRHHHPPPPLPLRHRPPPSAHLPRTRRSNTFSGDDGDDPFRPGGGGWNYGFGSGSGQGWYSSEPDVPTERRSAAEVALGVIYELMCLIAFSTAPSLLCGGSRDSSQPASRRCASFPPSAEPELADVERTVRSPTAPVSPDVGSASYT